MSIINFESSFSLNQSKFKTITLDSTDIHNCVSYIKGLVFNDTGLHKIESGVTKYKEIFNRVCYITALSKVINFPLIDYKDMDTPVLEQFKRYVGRWSEVIFFNYGEFPLFYYPIYKKSIFICKVNDYEYCICGYGDQVVVNSYSNKSLVVSKNLREYSNMSAFYGFENLIRVPDNIYDFQNLMK